MDPYAAPFNRTQQITHELRTLQQPRFGIASSWLVSTDSVSIFPLQSLPHSNRQTNQKNLYKEMTVVRLYKLQN